MERVNKNSGQIIMWGYYFQYGVGNVMFYLRFLVQERETFERMNRERHKRDI